MLLIVTHHSILDTTPYVLMGKKMGPEIALSTQAQTSAPTKRPHSWRRSEAWKRRSIAERGDGKGKGERPPEFERAPGGAHAPPTA